MFRSVSTLIIVLTLAACGSGGNNAAPPVVATPPAPPAPGPTASEELTVALVGLTINELYEESFKALIYRSPESIVQGALTTVYPLADAHLDNLSDGFLRETFTMYQVILDALLSYDRSAMTADEQLTFDFYAWYLRDSIDRLPFIYHDFLATYNFNGVQRNTELFFTSVHPMATQQDAENYVARLIDIQLKFDRVVEFLTNQLGAGIVEPSVTLDVAISNLGAVADRTAEQSPYFSTFASKVDAIAGLSASDRQALLDSARAAIDNNVIPAYQTLRRQLQQMRTSAPSTIGVGQYPMGTEYYNYQLKHHTTTDLTAAEIHQLGLDELARIQAEMRALFDQLGYPANETLQQLFARVAVDGGIIPAANVKSTYEDIVAATELVLDQAFDIFPSADVIVADDPFGGFYIGPSFDGSRPGAFYAGTQTDEAWYRMPSLAYHEAVPGHHTQVAIAMDQNGASFRRIVRFTAFVEGWALYAERLAYEQGWYANDTYGNLGRLQYEALRAARLVMDTGIHSMGWSFGRATQFNSDNIGASTGSSQNATGRYSVVPGQATAYMVGMLHILSLRQHAMDSLGAQFDLKTFHRVLLQSGGIPLSLLDDVIERYIEDTLAVP
jgi:uncharacterized protein (DUF885 family)